MGNDDAKACHNQITVNAFMAEMGLIIEEKLAAFKQEMQQMNKRGFTRTGVGTNSYTRPRYLREEKTSYYKGSKSVVTPKECDKVALATQHPKVKSEALKNQAFDAKSIRQQKVEPHTRLRKQLEYEEIRRCRQEAFEAAEAKQKKIQAAHQFVDIDQKHGLDLNITESKAEQAKVSEQLNKVVYNSSHDVIIVLACPKEAEKGTGHLEERLATQQSVIYPDKEMEQSSLEPRVSPDSTPKERDLTTNSTPYVLFDTKLSDTHDLIRYWQNFMVDHSFKYSSFNVSISRIMHLVCSMSFEKETRAEGVLNMLMIKRPPDWQGLQSIHKEFRQGTINRIGKCKTSNVELNHSQRRSLTSYIQFKEHPSDKCRLNLNHRTYGNYLDSQKRMKPELLSLGTGQAILRTRIDQRMEYGVDHNQNIYQDQGFHIREENLVYEWTPMILKRARDKEFEYNKISIYVFKDPFIFDHTDIIRLFLPRMPNIGTQVALKRAQRIQKWEEDKLFKPPDLFQDGNISIFILIKEEPPDLVQTRHQNYSLFILIKEEPPDTSYKPQTKLHIFRGNFLVLLHFMIINLFYVHADNSDLRTNPFQVGGDDMIMDSMEDITKDAPKGPMTRARTRLFNQAIGGMLKELSMEKEEFIQTTMFLIKAREHHQMD